MFSRAHEEWPEWDADAPAQRRAQTQAQQIAAIIAPQRRSSAAHLIAQLRGGPLMALRVCDPHAKAHPRTYSARANLRIREPFTRHGLMPWSAHRCGRHSFVDPGFPVFVRFRCHSPSVSLVLGSTVPPSFRLPGCLSECWSCSAESVQALQETATVALTPSHASRCKEYVSPRPTAAGRDGP